MDVNVTITNVPWVNWPAPETNMIELTIEELVVGELSITNFLTDSWTADAFVAEMRRAGQLTNVVTLMMGGIICEVRGHKWEGGCGMIGCLAIHSGPMRHCVICGKVEAQELGPWQ
jgi:hypothetical protein